VLTDHHWNNATCPINQKHLMAFSHNLSMDSFKLTFRQSLALVQRGFTLIELMVTIAFLAIVMSLAVPSFQQTIASSRLTSTATDVYSSLLQARADAISQGERMTVCKSSDGSTCATGTTTWSIGWITFVDSSRTLSATVDTGETVSYVVQATDPSITISGNANVANYVSFSADGKSKTIAGGFQTGVIRICSSSPALTDDTRARDLTLNIAGKITIGKPPGISAACTPLS
jgi:type IV fimbrial biogenesis protein FimT